jgi:hypothetical protein
MPYKNTAYEKNHFKNPVKSVWVLCTILSGENKTLGSLTRGYVRSDTYTQLHNSNPKLFNIN